MQRYSFFVNHQNFYREKLKIYVCFNSCLQLKHRIVDAHIIILYTKEAVLRTATRGCTQQESTTDRGKQRKISQEKEGVRYGKGDLEPQKQLFGTAKATVWHCESNGLTLRNINKNHPRRSLRASAPTDTSIRADRYEHLRRSMRMTKVGSMQKKRDGVNEGKERCMPPFFAFATQSDANAICEYL